MSYVIGKGNSGVGDLNPLQASTPEAVSFQSTVGIPTNCYFTTYVVGEDANNGKKLQQ